MTPRFLRDMLVKHFKAIIRCIHICIEPRGMRWNLFDPESCNNFPPALVGSRSRCIEASTFLKVLKGPFSSLAQERTIDGNW